MGKSLIIKGANFAANSIPMEFTRLDWIGGSTSETSHINSGVFWGNKEDSLDDELQFAVTLNSTGLTTTDFRSIGARMNSWTYCNAWFSPTFVKFEFANAAIQPSVNLFDGIKHVITINKNGGMIDSVAYPFETAPSQYDGSQAGVFDNIPIYLDSASKQNGNYAIDGLSTAMKIHWVKYRRNSSLILDAIPVRRVADNVICFYDGVSGNYFTRNDGSTPVAG